MPAVEPVEECEVLPLSLALQVRRRVEIEDPRLLRPQHGPLVQRGHEAARPVDRAVDRMAVRVGEDHVGRAARATRCPARRRASSPCVGRPVDARRCPPWK